MLTNYIFTSQKNDYTNHCVVSDIMVDIISCHHDVISHKSTKRHLGQAATCSILEAYNLLPRPLSEKPNPYIVISRIGMT